MNSIPDLIVPLFVLGPQGAAFLQFWNTIGPHLKDIILTHTPTLIPQIKQFLPDPSTVKPYQQISFLDPSPPDVEVNHQITIHPDDHVPDEDMTTKMELREDYYDYLHSVAGAYTSHDIYSQKSPDAQTTTAYKNVARKFNNATGYSEESLTSLSKSENLEEFSKVANRLKQTAVYDETSYEELSGLLDSSIMYTTMDEKQNLETMRALMKYVADEQDYLKKRSLEEKPDDDSLVDVLNSSDARNIVYGTLSQLKNTSINMYDNISLSKIIWLIAIISLGKQVIKSSQHG